MAQNTPKLSFWEWQSYFKEIDVAIIGSGIVGLNAAIQLKLRQPTLRVLVLERGALPMGASTRNAGFACFGSLTELLADLDANGEEAVWNTLQSRWQGLQMLRERFGDKNIGYKACGNYEVFTPEEESTFQHCMKHLPTFNHILAELLQVSDVFAQKDEAVKQMELSGVGHLIFNRAEGQIDTGKLMQAMLERARALGISILNGISIESLDAQISKVQLQTQQGWTIEARKVLVATNGFAQQLVDGLDVKPARNLVLLTPPIADLNWEACFHYDRGYYYWRNIGQRVLIGGGRCLFEEAEQTAEFGRHEQIAERLQQMLYAFVPKAAKVGIERWWSGILGVGEQKAPVIEAVAPNVVVAVRLGGMGVAIGTAIGSKGADFLLDNW